MTHALWLCLALMAFHEAQTPEALTGVINLFIDQLALPDPSPDLIEVATRITEWLSGPDETRLKAALEAATSNPEASDEASSHP